MTRHVRPAVGLTTEFRPEIEGLRAVAALLVATYHIWLGRVSGGVDVFFVISGYLVTLSILRDADRSGKPTVVAFWMRLIRRLAPAAFLILAVILAGCFLILPRSRWLATEQEILASALYVENWLLAFNAVDYLQAGSAASPTQHFWALSIQGQFYLLWPLLIAGTLAAAHALKRKSKGLLLGLGAVACAASFAYSIKATAENQPWAYFDTAARFWEFGIGGLLAISSMRFALPQILAAVAGWAALAAIVSCGMIFKAAQSFPGLGALWPTLAAMTILIVGSDGGRYGVGALLASRPMVALGGVAYHLYLWHWPLLVFLIASRGGKGPTDLQSAAILAGSISLSFLSARWIEAPIRQRRLLSDGSLLAVLAAAIIVLLPLGYWMAGVTRAEQARLAAIAEQYPGAKVRMPGYTPPVAHASLPVIPPPLAAKEDVTKIFRDGCHESGMGGAPSMCTYGNRVDPGLRLVLVGGSHSAHYFPALEALAIDSGWRIDVLVKAACRWTTDLHPTNLSDAVNESCREWNRLVTPEILALKPDLIVTTSNIRKSAAVPEGYLDQWQRMAESGIPVLAIRDTPTFPFDVPECVEENGPSSEKCIIARSTVLDPIAPEQTFATSPGNVTFADLSHYFCDEQFCPPVIGGVLVYRDHDHLTATYARTLAPMLAPYIEEAVATRIYPAAGN